MKFEVISFNTFEVMPRTRFRDAQTDGRMDVRTDGQGDSSKFPQTSFVGGITRACLGKS